MTDQFEAGFGKLAAPGAGISGSEMFLLNKVIKPLMIRNAGCRRAIQLLRESASEIKEAVGGIEPQALTKRVLVNRPWFVEDSSRDWSAAMLCRHLAIVDSALARAIEAGIVAAPEDLPAPSKRVAAVKPEAGRNDPAAVSDFIAAVESLAAAAGKHEEGSLARRMIPHPWLGEITHLQWVWFAGFHHRIHLRQLRAITRGLGR